MKISTGDRCENLIAAELQWNDRSGSVSPGQYWRSVGPTLARRYPASVLYVIPDWESNP